MVLLLICALPTKPAVLIQSAKMFVPVCSVLLCITGLNHTSITVAMPERLRCTGLTKVEELISIDESLKTQESCLESTELLLLVF